MQRQIRPAAPAPVVAPEPEQPTERCAACRSITTDRHREVVAGTDMVLCDDAPACARRYRRGGRPAAMAAVLRHESSRWTPLTYPAAA